MNDTTRQRVQQLFDKELANPVEILVFYNDTEEETVEYASAAKEILAELAAVSNGKLTVREIDAAQSAEAATYQIDKVPSLVFLDAAGQDQGFRFFGAPIGYEFMALMEDIVDVSKGQTRLSDEARAEIKAVQEDVVIRVYSTPG